MSARRFRTGGAFVAVAIVAFVGGWLVPSLTGLAVHVHAFPERCFRIAWTARVTTGQAEELGPILLVQTAWASSSGRDKARFDRVDPCKVGEVQLRLPPVKDARYERRAGAYFPIGRRGRLVLRPSDFTPARLGLRVPARSAAEGSALVERKGRRS